MKKRRNIFKNMDKMKLCRSRLGGILKRTTRRQRKDSHNFSRKEWRDGLNKKGELMLQRLRLLKNVSKNWYFFHYIGKNY